MGSKNSRYTQENGVSLQTYKNINSIVAKNAEAMQVPTGWLICTYTSSMVFVNKKE